MSEKKAMERSEIEALITDGLCSNNEATRQETQVKLLEESSTNDTVADQLARKSAYLDNADFIIETLMKIPLNIKLKALERLTLQSGSRYHPYQEIGKKALREAIQLFKENKDTESLLKIRKGNAPQDIRELALKALEELGEKPNPLKPYPYQTLIVDSIKDVTIEDDWVRCNVSIDRSTKVFTANFCVEAGVIQPVKITGKTEADYKEEREYLVSQGFEEASSRNDGEFIYYWYKRLISDEHQAKITNDAVQKLVKNLRKGASQQDQRIESALMLGEILEDDKLITAAKQLKPIDGRDARNVEMHTLRQRDGQLWSILDQVLDAKGYPPATTLEENMLWNSRSSGEQVARWFGEDAADHAREIIQTNQQAKQKCAEILSILGKPSDVPLLATLLADDKDRIRASAVTALGNIDAPEALQTIIQHSDSEEGFETRTAIATALGNTDNPIAISVLEKLLWTNGPHRENAGVSLISHGRIDIVLNMMNTHSDKYFQLYAVKALTKSEQTSDTIPHLLQALHHPYYIVNIEAIKRLGDLQVDEALQPIKESLKSGSYWVKNAAIDALVLYGNQAVEALGDCVDDVDLPEWASEKNKPTISELAKRGLETIGTPEAQKMLEKWG